MTDVQTQTRDPSKFIAQLSGIMEVPDTARVRPDSQLIHLGLDSVKAAEICAFLEHEYDVVLPVEAFAQNLTVNDLLALITR